MMTRFVYPIALVVSLFSSAALAENVDSKSNSDSDSAANAQIAMYGSDAINNTPSVGGPSMNNTGPCLVATSGGLSVPGLGLSAGGARSDKKCDIRAEAYMIYNMVGRAEGVEHLCSDPDMRRTLMPYGHCRVYRDAPPTNTGRATRSGRAQTTVAAANTSPFSACSMNGNTIRVTRSDGFTNADAVAACRAYLRK